MSDCVACVIWQALAALFLMNNVHYRVLGGLFDMSGCVWHV